MTPGRRLSVCRKVEADWEVLPAGVNRIVSTIKRKEVALMETYGHVECIEEYVEVKPNKQYLSNTDLVGPGGHATSEEEKVPPFPSPIQTPIEEEEMDKGYKDSDEEADDEKSHNSLPVNKVQDQKIEKIQIAKSPSICSILKEEPIVLDPNEPIVIASF
mmetsp:Transcript_5000/g.3635  ORF Transcript_5000/g.3635 Transcript_5000/m.3635 type:complete len:160 (+) Transcript_5000:316-795(+)|eukprot:CAMPEP_0202957196 /NCGR_PEP_ID=MMETSP1396-20130829/1627_1 /ASSEMBLY_ACC=CAM_ASM_000872 /TAXON_ID= /ORGANISM="Pseudokeronopsis sp., Strain Brazil" /LENGTH=159 /DNA_ID=CAMNT_0049674563 /DNA_START=316 /DNA_END=795 /DNA_ORIENTATION=+